ncbi:AbaSI family restriction endonuclease [Profundibacter sp.]
MNKDEYILRSLSKIKHKRWELYIVSRIVHCLDDPEIEFVCQQLVRREDGIALTDMYFPQFGIHLEIDEAQHSSDAHKKADADRMRDIINATEHEILQIKTYKEKGKLTDKDLITINGEVDKFVQTIRKRKEIDKDFEPWDFDKRYSPEPHIECGSLNIKNNPVFRYQRDALRCLGYKGGHYQRGAWILPTSKSCAAWFPRLYNTKKWENSLSDDGKTITEIDKLAKPTNQAQKRKHDCWDSRIVFARYMNELGHVLYRFLGEFKYDHEASEDNKNVYHRINKCVPIIK